MRPANWLRHGNPSRLVHLIAALFATTGLLAPVSSSGADIGWLRRKADEIARFGPAAARDVSEEFLQLTGERIWTYTDGPRIGRRVDQFGDLVMRNNMLCVRFQSKCFVPFELLDPQDQQSVERIMELGPLVEKFCRQAAAGAIPPIPPPRFMLRPIRPSVPPPTLAPLEPSIQSLIQSLLQPPVQPPSQPPIPSPTPQPVNRAQEEVNAISGFLGLPFIPTRPGQVPNAVAMMEPDQFGQPTLTIVFNGDFLNDLDRRCGKWGPLSVLAHEVGHHFHGDATFYGAFSDSWTEELRADFVSGYVLAKAGASEEQSTRALRSLFTLTGSLTHPDTPKRLDALTAGWRKGAFGP